MHIKVVWVGRTRNTLLRSLSADYLERTRHLVSCEIVEIRDLSKSRGLRGASLLSAEGAEIDKFLSDTCRIVGLDIKGVEYSSRDFARWFQSEQDQGTRELAFVIGGPDGLDSALLKRAHLTLSLGKMTWTHEMSRVLLLEQIYRAFSILRNIPYHK